MVSHFCVFINFSRRNSSLGGVEPSLEQEHDHYMTLRKQTGTLEKQLEVNKPLVNLVDNLVTMGSLYGGQDSSLLNYEYKKVSLIYMIHELIKVWLIVQKCSFEFTVISSELYNIYDGMTVMFIEIPCDINVLN